MEEDNVFLHLWTPNLESFELFKIVDLRHLYSRVQTSGHEESATKDDEWLLRALILDLFDEKVLQLCLVLGALNRDKVGCLPLQ